MFYDGTKYMSSNSQGGGVDAEKIKYDNSQSGLNANNVQDAIDEIDGTIDKIERGEVDDTNVPLGSSINNYIGGTRQLEVRRNSLSYSGLRRRRIKR